MGRRRRVKVSRLCQFSLLPVADIDDLAALIIYIKTKFEGRSNLYDAFETYELRN